jgi:AAA family ATPase
MAKESGLPMIELSGADVYSPYVGDAEATIRKTFRRAREASPCVLFLDEIDALVTNRFL